METKDIIGLWLILLALPAGIVACCVSERLRDAAFLLLVAGTTRTGMVDINFVTRFWYRGTTRGFEFTFIDVLALSLLVSLLLVPRPGQARFFWPASLGMMLLYLGYNCFSVATSEPRLYGLFELSKMFRAIAVFLAVALFVRGERELALLVFALCCVVCFEGVVAMKQRVLDGAYRVNGSLDHPNSLSMYLCLTGPVLVAAAASNLPAWLRYFAMISLGSAAMSVLFTISRAGIPAFALATLGTAAFCLSWRITVQKLAVAAIMVLVLGGLLFKSWDTLSVRFGSATLEQEYMDDKGEGRGMYLRQAAAIAEERYFGVGLNNWSYWVCKAYGAKIGMVYEDYDDLDYIPSKEILPSFHYAAPAHNLAALTVGELGVPGLVLFGILWLRWFHMGAGFLWLPRGDLRRDLAVGICFGIGGVFLQSLTEWVFRQTQILFAFHIMLGVLAGLCHWKRETKRRQIEARADEEPAAMTLEAMPAGR